LWTLPSFFAENACLNPRISTTYLRKKEFWDTCEATKIYPEEYFLGDSKPTSKSKILIYDVHQLIIQKLEKSGVSFSNDYPLVCIPHYARELKGHYKDDVITSFMDSPSHSR
jgi:hypothetical protein